jgi:hypothetical protein
LNRRGKRELLSLGEDRRASFGLDERVEEGRKLEGCRWEVGGGL